VVNAEVLGTYSQASVSFNATEHGGDRRDQSELTIDARRKNASLKIRPRQNGDFVSNLTIGIPTLNRADLIAKLVQVCLSQTLPPYEIIVSDDASNDTTLEQLEALANPRLKVLRQRARLGMIANWNACLAACVSDYFVLVSDDDMISSDFTTHVEATLATAPDTDLLIIRGRIVDRLTDETNANHPPIKTSGSVDFVRDILPAWLDSSFVLPFASMVFKTATLRNAGGFVTSFPYASDAATWLPIAVRGRCAFYPEAKVDCIVHEGMATRTFCVESLIDDIVKLTALVNTEVKAQTTIPLALVQKIKRLSKTYMRRAFGHMMITSARRGVSKAQLLSAWISYAPKIPFYGLGALSLGAILVPRGLIQVIGWPYRKWVNLRRYLNRVH
jgi:glycosyltransferase involved in cell wall biosynthesis